ncbi:hypothetical protein PCANC_15928 [Puccinia coronata f. sp. avenae]|uniref:Retrovirus-related Pol polyprotein from transposon TNT 1-94-like beta-barrel domain-containing protein n=1 Tax=Puccinia coronata f. sp. avenae TaxID=200324 RepID=A0A2N5SPM3_9BASI|nr:hypothetical protein PCANC_15928 [Puccinia coronata f. sp. avenae]
MRRSLLDIESVGIDIPPTIISYVILGKLMRAKGLNQLVDKIAMTEESVETPYLVLDALQTFKTHHLNKELNDSPAASALVTTAPSSSLAFPRKVLYYCANRQHDPLAKSHSEDQCFKKSPHLKEEFFKRKNKGPSNASASFAHATVLMASTTSANQDLFVLDLAASHNMLCNRSLFTNFSKANITIRTGDPVTPLVAKGHGTESIMRGGKLIRLENALYVSRISQRLISLVQLLADSLTITKSGETFKVTTATSVLFEGNIKDNILLGHPSNEILRGLCLPCPTSDNCNGDALGEFKKLLALVKNELNSTVKEIVSDRGGKHNGFAEQADHTIIEKASIFVDYENDGTTFRIIRLKDMKLVVARHARFTTSESASGLPPGASPPTTPPVSVEELFEAPPSTPLLAVTAHKAPNEIIGDISEANIIPHP